jgi:transcriptional regulator with XRE-family HTH domain
MRVVSEFRNEFPAQESADAKLAKNLVVARVIAGITQQELADASGISRATVAQIETGYSDPRLSTIVELAKALHMSPILLLVGPVEIQALTRLVQMENIGTPGLDTPLLLRMRQYLDTGMLKDRVRAAQVGAEAVESTASSPLGPISAGIFSAVSPGLATQIGARLGDLLFQSGKPLEQQSPAQK